MVPDPTQLDYRDPDWVAEKLGLDKNTVYKFLQDGTIPAVQLGRKWLVSEGRLAEWLRQETDNQTRARRDAVRSSDRTVRRLDALTGAARLAVKHAHTEARRYSHPLLDQDHLLLGLATEPRARAAVALQALGITDAALRSDLESRAGTGQVPRRLGRTPEAKRAMRLASKMAQRAAPDGQPALVGTDHLLLGTLLARCGRGYEILKRHGVTRNRLREALSAAGSRES